ncbi:MAG TPA: DUF4418 family protein [Dehalococcoidales bacterium]|nr:DUF4418 family protein [Dehalococcoidales bacterium]
MNKVLGTAIIVLALAIVIIPQYTNCSSEGRFLTLSSGKTTPMKCHWTARAEIAAGIPILGIGATMLFARKKESFRLLGGLSLVLAVMVMLLPTSLIGVCNGAMLCDTVMKPTLLTLGSLVGVASVLGIILSFRKGE